ncbi:MAG TPA: cation:proton antiporter, partial [Phycisphaerae bacterium]|nr:cation:proton antiporter [Phycisphaerae bacterium]
MHTALLLGAFGVLLAFSALFSRALERLGIPVVLLFLVLGMLAGSEGLGGIAFEDYRFAFRMGTAALVLILLDGGLCTSVDAVRRSFVPAGILATVGVVGTAALVAGGGYLFGLAWPAAALLGAIVSSTDVATVFAVLRGGRLNLAPRVATTLEVESGANDPMAVILTTIVTDWIMGGPLHLWSVVLHVPLQLGIGLLVG